MTIFYILATLLMIASTVDGQCACQNNGICLNGDACRCQPGFYGLVCSLYADTYIVEYVSTPTDVPGVIKNLNASLAKFFVYDIRRVPPGNVLKLSFNMKLSIADVEELKIFAASAALSIVSSVSDYDECNNGQQCYGGEICANTEGSFRCGCDDGYEVKDGKCIEVVDNTRFTIYIWCGAVAAILLFMIAALLFYQRRKIQKGKKLQKEAQKRAAIRKTALSPTNMSQFDRRITPPGSVVGGYDNHRPFSIHSDVASIYSYNSRHAMSEHGFHNHRLSVPILDGYQGVYDANQRFSPSVSEPHLSSSYPDDNSFTQLTFSNSGHIPTTFAPNLQDIHAQNYDENLPPPPPQLTSEAYEN